MLNLQETLCLVKGSLVMPEIEVFTDRGLNGLSRFFFPVRFSFRDQKFLKKTTKKQLMKEVA